MTERLSYQERRAVTLDNPALERLRTPGARRALSAAMIAVLAVELVLFALVPLLNVFVFVGAMVVLIFVMVMTLGALKASTRGIEELPVEVLDERQAQVRGAVYSLSYRTLAVVAITAMALILLAQTVWPDRADGIAYIGIAYTFQLAVVIPTLVAALRTRI